MITLIDFAREFCLDLAERILCWRIFGGGRLACRLLGTHDDVHVSGWGIRGDSRYCIRCKRSVHLRREAVDWDKVNLMSVEFEDPLCTKPLHRSVSCDGGRTWQKVNVYEKGADGKYRAVPIPPEKMEPPR